MIVNDVSKGDDWLQVIITIASPRELNVIAENSESVTSDKDFRWPRLNACAEQVLKLLRFRDFKFKRADFHKNQVQLTFMK